MGKGFDYIVAGSGSSGAVIAARLSEDPEVRVLLLEAGPRDRHPLQHMPLAFPRLALGRIGTWQFESEPELELHGRRLPIPRGRTLGGTSSVNAMIAVRGNRRDYDDWSAPKGGGGLAGWSFDEVPPSARPRGIARRLPCSSGSGSDSNCQVPIRPSATRGKASGMSCSGWRSGGPASSSSTDTAGSSLSRAATTAPAEPAPMTM